MSGFRKKIFRAGAWTMLGYGAAQVVRFATNLVMTRLLVPESFGVMSIALTFMFGLALFSDLGLRQNVVQSRRGDEPIFLGTAYAVQVLRGVLLFLMAILIAGGLWWLQHSGGISGTSVYAATELPAVIAVLALTAVVSGLESIKLATASRRLELGRVTLLELAGQAVAIPVMVLWAFYDRSIWALVVGAIAAGMTRAILSHIFLRGPAFSWDWERAALAEILGFGKWIFLSSVLGFFVVSADRLLLGGLVSAEILGMYAIAYLIVSALQQGLGKLSVGVALPVLSEIARRGNLDHLRANYYRGRFPFDVAALFAAGCLWQSGGFIVSGLYDHRYLAAGPMLSVLALTLVAARYDVAEKCFMAMGKPHWLTWLNLVRLFFLGVFVPTGFAYAGFAGALWALVAASFFGAMALIAMKMKEGLFDFWQELRVLPWFLFGVASGKGVVFWLAH